MDTDFFITLCLPVETVFVPFGKIRFELWNSTIALIAAFQQRHPDVTIEECSQLVNNGILKLMEEYESKCQ